MASVHASCKAGGACRDSAPRRSTRGALAAAGAAASGTTLAGKTSAGGGTDSFNLAGTTSSVAPFRSITPAAAGSPRTPSPLPAVPGAARIKLTALRRPQRTFYRFGHTEKIDFELGVCVEAQCGDQDEEETTDSRPGRRTRGGFGKAWRGWRGPDRGRGIQGVAHVLRQHAHLPAATGAIPRVCRIVVAAVRALNGWRRAVVHTVILSAGLQAGNQAMSDKKVGRYPL
jgi:hypothetical protein